MKDVKILGAGVSGLTAAINLAKEGYEVTVYEKANHIGARHNNDFQGLENWTTEKDILKIIKSCSITPSFFYKPIKEVYFYSPSLDKAFVKTKKPLLYLVKRGKGSNSLDRSLEKEAINIGVKIKFSSKIKEDGCDIVATGPKNISGWAFGITFETNLDDIVIGMLNDEIAPKGYAYLLVIENKATLATGFLAGFKPGNVYLDRAIGMFKKITNFDIKNSRKFSGYCNFFIQNSAKKDGRLYVGEAAGFQDCLFGFGMKYAFLSGFLAAKSIIEEKDYDTLWKRAFLDEMKNSLILRFFFEKLGNRGYEMVIKKLKDYKTLEQFKKQYHLSLRKKFLFPIIRVLKKG